VEVFVFGLNNAGNGNGSMSGQVQFLIKLNADFSHLPPYLLEQNTDEEKALLMVTYQNTDGGKVVPQLFLSPNIQRILNLLGGFKVKPFPAESGLIDYVPSVYDQIRDTVDILMAGYTRRREYIEAFLSQYRRYVLEYDVASYHTISFLFNYRDFHFIVTIELSQRFPGDQPLFKFQSIYHTGPDGQPFFRREKIYPYSPRWTSVEMADRARELILAKAIEFQRDSVNRGQKWELMS